MAPERLELGAKADGQLCPLRRDDQDENRDRGFDGGGPGI
jgi:hypothetical protein